MKRFEYRHGEIKEPKSSDDLERELNALGAEGWELIEMRRTTRPFLIRRGNPPLIEDKYVYEFFFKRELP